MRFHTPIPFYPAALVGIVDYRVHGVVRCRQGGFLHIALLDPHPRRLGVAAEEMVERILGSRAYGAQPQNGGRITLLHLYDVLRNREMVLDAAMRVILIARTLNFGNACTAGVRNRKIIRVYLHSVKLVTGFGRTRCEVLVRA
jgi:hypothetical protein